MKQKTAMMQLIDKLVRMPDSHIKNYLALVEYDLLEKEKEQIMDGFINGNKTDCMEHEDIRLYAEDYYNETYKHEA